MKIVILGAGQVGSSVAAQLAIEANDITVVDMDELRLRELQDRLDIRTVQGYASWPTVLMRAGIEDADLLIAVTNSDEINMMAAQVAYSLFNTPLKIARIRASEYLEHPELFNSHDCPVDHHISPEQEVTDYIKSLIEFPSALQVLDFAEGRAQLVTVRASEGGWLVGKRIREMTKHLPEGVETRVAAIFRGKEAFIPHAGTIIEEDDIVYFLAARKDIQTVISEMRRLEAPVKRIILSGGGNIGFALARALEKKYHTKLIERSRERAQVIAETLETAIVLVGDCSDVELLQEESIEKTDVYVALTNDDEANILSSMLAKKLGARKVITLINRPAYIELVEAGSIDIAISPQQVTIGALLTHVRRGEMVRVHSLSGGKAEAIEAVAIGDRSSSKVIGRRIDEIKLPAETTIGGVVRGDAVLMAHHDFIIQKDDHIILFVLDKKQISAVEKLFQPSVSFI